jgi:hypothetical protein
VPTDPDRSSERSIERQPLLLTAKEESMNKGDRRASRDWARQPIWLMAWWGLPILIAMSTSAAGLPLRAVAFIWTGAFVWMGTGCLLNALRCHRLHCYISGPVLLAGAAAAALIGFGILSGHMLNVVVWTTTGLVILSFAPETVFGAYRAR